MTGLPTEPCVRLAPVGEDGTGIVGSGVTQVIVGSAINDTTFAITTTDGVSRNITTGSDLSASDAAGFCQDDGVLAWTFGR